MTEDELRAVRVGELVPLAGKIEVVDYDPAWRDLFARDASRIQAALGERVRLLEHVGSTSVPGLAAKPRIDILLAVVNSADEAGYVPALEASGYVLRIREPAWHEHRLLKGQAFDTNLHVLSDDCPEIERMLRFRDRLRASDADASCTRAPSASSRAAMGGTPKSTPTRRPPSWRRSSREHAAERPAGARAGTVDPRWPAARLVISIPLDVVPGVCPAPA